MLGAAASALAAPVKPNIIIILADDLGYGDLSSYGAADLRTPNIDAVGRTGIRFLRFYSNCPVCSPTRAALLSGRYPDRAGVPGVIRTDPANSWGYLSPDAMLAPVRLKSAGYHTAIVGKWHLGLESPNTPTERGFDSFHGFLGDMMDDYLTHRRHGQNYMRRNRETIDPPGHATGLFTQWAVDYLNARKGAADPFFLYLAYNAPHTPIQPPPEWIDRVKLRQPGITSKRANVAALIEHMDDGVGRVLDALRRNGQDRNTLVVFTSDNGGHLPSGGTAGNLRGGKQDMYEGGIRVPLLASWPGRIAPGSEPPEPGLSMDLCATVCEAAGVAPPEDIDGRSLLLVLEGRVPVLPQRDMIWVRREGGAMYEGRDYYALRRGDWKLLQNTPFEPYRLYDLAADPLEKDDRAPNEPKRFRELKAALSLHVQRAGRVPWQKPGVRRSL
jgi:arylsulfatase A-like enzyme